MTYVDLMLEILKLPPDERRWIGETIMQMVAREETPEHVRIIMSCPPYHGKRETPEEFMVELDRRMAEMDAHPESVVSWEELKRELDRDEKSI